MKKIILKKDTKTAPVLDTKKQEKMLKMDIVRLLVEKKTRRLVNTMLPSQKRKELARVLTQIRQKEIHENT